MFSVSPFSSHNQWNSDQPLVDRFVYQSSPVRSFPSSSLALLSDDPSRESFVSRQVAAVVLKANSRSDLSPAVRWLVLGLNELGLAFPPANILSNTCLLQLTAPCSLCNHVIYDVTLLLTLWRSGTILKAVNKFNVTRFSVSKLYYGVLFSFNSSN